MEILRNARPDELAGDVTDETSKAFVPIVTPTGKVLSVKDRFEARIAKEGQIAIKKGLPFATIVVREEIKDLQDEFDKKFKRQGYVKNFKIPTLDEIDWKKYSDVKNFEVLEEGKEHDKYLSKIHRLPVFIKYTKYKYKGFSNTYTVMEAEESALIRAQEAIDKRKPLK